MEMQILVHHIYELKKGLRRLVLHTCPTHELQKAVTRLNRDKIPYLTSRVNDSKTNIFFGEQVCVNVIRQFSTLKLNELSDQEDFILGTLLGYDLKLQCLRFLERRCINESERVRTNFIIQGETS